MLTLAMVSSSPVAAAISLIGEVLLAVLAVGTIGLWIFIARKTAQQRADDRTEAAEAAAAETEPDRQLVVVNTPTGPNGAVLSELDPVQEPDSISRDQLEAGRANG